MRAASQTGVTLRAGRNLRLVYIRVDPSLLWEGQYVGGAATHTTGVIKGFVDNGLDVDVFAAQPPEGIRGASVSVVPVRRMFQIVRGLTYADYSRRLNRAVVGQRPDFVYQRYQLGADAGLEIARRFAVPLVLEFNGSELWVERNWGSGHLRLGGLFEAVERRNLVGAALVVVVSEPLREQLAGYGVPDARILVNPNGTDVDRLAPLRDAEPLEWRRTIGLAQAPTVGFVGTFGLWHGVRLLPSIIEAVRGRNPTVRWNLVGGGELWEEVKDEVRDRGLGDLVYMPGSVQHDKALELMAASDVCISPHVPNPDGSPFFGSPTKIFEYMGLRKAIVASDLEQIGDVIEDGVSGRLVTPGDVDATAGAVIELISDGNLRERLGAGALAAAEKSYSWTAHTQRILDALASQIQ